MADEYASVSRGRLKLKTDSEISKKKKKKKSKDKEREMIEKTSTETIQIVPTSSESARYTKAELAFKKQQEKIQQQRIMEKAKKTHKQQVEKFNEKLDSLTEHFDIPKVSWTK